MYVVKTPRWVKWLPGFHWPKPATESGVFLSFDDGPHPAITPWLLELLEQYNAKTTFFYRGTQAEQFPDLVNAVKTKGHAVGNHSYSHLNGWNSGYRNYMEDIDKAAACTSGKLFRPPYGKISPRQLMSVTNRGYSVVLWDIMPGDFDESISAETCFRRIIQHLAPGVVIVLHENEKSEEKLRYIMPRLLEHLKAHNLVAEKIII
jgi:peptidoglycan-N-acetylglucosamine deacetylase